MRRRLDHQRDFSEPFLPHDVGRDEVLERVDGLVDWGALEAVCGDVYAAPVGRPSYPLSVLIKALLVQAWWNLSDPKAEQLLGNDLRFRRFWMSDFPARRPTGTRCGAFGTSFRSVASRRGCAPRSTASSGRVGWWCGVGRSRTPR